MYSEGCIWEYIKFRPNSKYIESNYYVLKASSPHHIHPDFPHFVTVSLISLYRKSPEIKIGYENEMMGQQ